jgi:eight-cysteine-cluster-containing protein
VACALFCEHGRKTDENGCAMCACVEPVCTASLDVQNPTFERFERPSAANACASDTDCVASGCSAEICAAESLNSTCEALAVRPEGSCGCLDGVCQWQTCEVPPPPARSPR